MYGKAPKRAGSKKWIVKGDKKAEEAEAEEDAAPAEPVEAITSPLLLEPFTGPSYSADELLRIRGQVGGAGEEQELAVHPYSFEERVAEEPKEVKPEPRTRGKKKTLTDSAKVSETANADGAEASASTEARTVSLSQATMGSATPTVQPALDPWMMQYIQSMSMFYPAAAALYGSPAGYTTIMLRNIPNRYTRDMLIQRLDQGFKEQYDFVYLPIDFNSKCNVGYAFINFRTPAACQRFFTDFNGVKTKLCLPGFSSQKVCEVSYARVQGRDANMENLKDDKFVEKLNERPDWQPLFLDDNGKEIPLSKVFEKGAGGRKRTKSGGNEIGASPTAAQSPMAMAAGMPGFFHPAFGAPMMSPWGMMGSPFGNMSSELSLAMVLQNPPGPSTVMLRNVPLSISRAELLELMNKEFKGAFDFLYYPLDMRVKEKEEDKDKEPDKPEEEQSKTQGAAGAVSRGFAYINFRTTSKAKAFTDKFKGKASELFPGSQSDKDVDVVAARVNTVDKSLNRFKADLEREKTIGEEWYPLLFSSGGDPVKFPLGQAPSPLPPVPPEAVDARSLEKKMETEVDGASAEKADAEGASSAAAADGSSATAATEGSSSKAAAKAEARPSPLPVGPGFMPPFMGGYPFAPGSPVHAMSPMSPMHIAAQAHAMAAAQVHAAAHAAQASAHAAQVAAGLLDPLAEAVNPSSSQPPKDAKRNGLRNQVEYYFSENNLIKDMYLRTLMDSGGWVELSVIAGFPKVKKEYGGTPALVADVLASSELLEVDPEVKKVRLKSEESRNRWRLAKASAETPSTADTTA